MKYHVFKGEHLEMEKIGLALLLPGFVFKTPG